MVEGRAQIHYKYSPLNSPFTKHITPVFSFFVPFFCLSTCTLSFLSLSLDFYYHIC